MYYLVLLAKLLETPDGRIFSKDSGILALQWVLQRGTVSTSTQ